VIKEICSWLDHPGGFFNDFAFYCYYWPFLHVYSARKCSIFHFNFRLNFQRLCRLLRRYSIARSYFEEAYAERERRVPTKHWLEDYLTFTNQTFENLICVQLHCFTEAS